MTEKHPGSDELTALLHVIADPAKHKARLDELTARHDDAAAKLAEFNAMSEQTRRLNTSAQAETIVLNNRKAALDKREAEIADSQKQHDEAVAAHKLSSQQTLQRLQQREADLSRREVAIKAREDDFAARETALAKAEARAKETTERLQRQAAAVKVALAS